MMILSMLEKINLLEIRNKVNVLFLCLLNSSINTNAQELSRISDTMAYFFCNNLALCPVKWHCNLNHNIYQLSYISHIITSEDFLIRLYGLVSSDRLPFGEEEGRGLGLLFNLIFSLMVSEIGVFFWLRERRGGCSIAQTVPL